MIIVLDLDLFVPLDREVPEAPVSPTGAELYQSLSRMETSMIIFSTIPNSQLVRTWLIREGVRDFISVTSMEHSPIADPIEWKTMSINMMLAQNAAPAFYYSIDPVTVDAVSAAGVNACLVVAAEPERNLVTEFRPWNELAATIKERRQRAGEIAAQRGEWQ